MLDGDAGCGKKTKGDKEAKSSSCPPSFFLGNAPLVAKASRAGPFVATVMSRSAIFGDVIPPIGWVEERGSTIKWRGSSGHAGESSLDAASRPPVALPSSGPTGSRWLGSPRGDLRCPALFRRYVNSCPYTRAHCALKFNNCFGNSFRGSCLSCGGGKSLSQRREDGRVGE